MCLIFEQYFCGFWLETEKLMMHVGAVNITRATYDVMDWEPILLPIIQPFAEALVSFLTRHIR